MANFSKLLKKEHMGQMILSIVFVLYLVLGYKTPRPVANLVDTMIGKIVIFAVVIYMFLCSNPILAVLSLFVAFDLIRRSAMVSNVGLQKYVPSEQGKFSQFTAFNQFPYTLEQEVVKKMAPIVRSGSVLKKASYKPYLENTRDASPLTGSN
jgi:hypothetical protein